MRFAATLFAFGIATFVIIGCAIALGDNSRASVKVDDTTLTGARPASAPRFFK
jgi:hypothetical protein